MVRSRRPVRGGRTKLSRRELEQLQKKLKQKNKGKFNFRQASYVKDRDAKNAEIENRRKLLEEQENKKRKHEESESSEEEEEVDPMTELLSTFSGVNKYSNEAIDSESDTESEEDELDEEEEEEEVQVGEEDLDEEEEEEDVDEEEEEDEEEEDDDEENNSSSKKLHKQTPESDDETIEIPLKEEDEEDPETTREDSGLLRDPFSLHLNHDLSDDLYESLSKDSPLIKSQSLSWPALGNMTIQIPQTSSSDSSSSQHKDKKIKASLLQDRPYAELGTVPVPIATKTDWNSLYIKSQIQNNIAPANQVNLEDTSETNSSVLTPLQRELFSIMNNYQDLLYSERTFDNEREIMFTYCLHAINHALKTRTKILHHNAKLSKSGKIAMSDVPDEYRDQGLVRPKILIIVPFRNSCLKIVKLLIAILIGEDKGGSVVNKKRFMEDFGSKEIIMPKKNPKPEDYEMTFKGNTDDTFKIGISITKKTIKLYSEFYSSDIIISSVLGLRMLIGAEGEEERDYDFLASIEMLIMDQTELFYMQNWDHLIHVFNHLHLQPANSRDTDYSRIRSWCVNGWSKYYRQTLIFSSLQLPEIQSIFNKKCKNYSGKIKIINPCLSGSVCKIIVPVSQVFYKFNATSSANAIDARMEFFINKILPQYKDSIMNHTLIFVPSYFDYVKIRNYMKNEELSFVQICEYSKQGKIARARDMFYHSDAHFLLYSERFHFYRRIRVKGIRHLIFFAPPIYPNFYSEMCNLMHESNQNPRAGSESNMTVTTIYSKYDIMQLSAILGTQEAVKMIKSDKCIHNTIM